MLALIGLVLLSNFPGPTQGSADKSEAEALNTRLHRPPRKELSFLNPVWLIGRGQEASMIKAKMLMSLIAATLSLGFTVQPHPAPFWDTNIIIAIQTDEYSSAAKSATMGKDDGTRMGGASQANPPENDTQKVDQPPRQNPSTGDQ